MSTKEAYIKKIKVQIDKLNAEISKLEAKALHIGEDTKHKVEPKIRDLQKYADVLKNKISELQETGGDSWKELKHGIDESWVALKKGIKEAKGKLKK